MAPSGSKLVRQLTFDHLLKVRLTKRQKIISRLGRLSFFIACSVALFPADALAQITPDGTVPTTVEQAEEIMRINGGEREGNNLFHSFDEFSIPEGMEAIFENATDIENIFTRVTGNEVSNINGILTTQGEANFFFINPNGIVFGDNASLNVGGSFIASTAENIQFEDGSQFSATNPEEPILTVSFPVGLGLGSNPGAITVNGTGNQITNDSTFSSIEFAQRPTGLSVPTGKTLALVGSGINFNGGVITNEGGKVYLNSVTSGSLNINQTEEGLTLSSENITQYQDINLNQQSLIDAGEEKLGSISLIGKNINFSNASFLLSQNQGDLSGGFINVKALESLSLLGTSPDSNISSAIRSETLSLGEGANITISSNQLVLQDEAAIRTSSFSDATGGNLNVDVSNNIQLSNSSSISASTFAQGNAGNIQLSTSSLRVTDAGTITSSTIGTGLAGEVTINAEQIEVDGVLSQNGRNDRSNISASSFNTGDAGSLNINTAKLKITNGAQIGSGAFADGNSNSITINASSSVEVSGSKGDFQSSIRASAEPTVSEAAQRALGLPDVPSGSAGNVIINTPSLNVNSGGQVSVANEGTGNAGTLSINAEDINLDNSGSITAASASGNGGNINLNTDNLQINNESQITTEAGNNGDGGNITINTSNLSAKKNSNLTTSAIGGDGGNINITADTILGLENSDITASAVGGNGGNIIITTDLIYGYQARSQTTPFEDITASSELGIDGTVTINSPETSVEEDLILSAKKIEFNDYKKLLQGSCLDENRPGREEFTYIGGGIPESPDKYFLDQEDDEEYSLSPNSSNLSEELQNQANKTPTIWQEGDPIVPANAVEVRNGRKFLVAVNEISDTASSICNPDVENADPTARIKVKQIKFKGNKVFSDEQLKNIVPFTIGSNVTIEKLFALQSKITNYYVNQGYISSGAFIASQEMTNGVIEVQVIEGILAQAEIKGLSRFKKSYFTNRLPLGKPLKQNKLLSILTRFRNNPLIEDLEAELIRISPEKSRIVIKLKEKNPLQTQFAVSNSFSPSIGTFGGEANFNYHFLGQGDLLNFGYSQTKKTGLVRYEAGYTFPINKYDGTININYTDASTNIVEEPTSALDIQADFKSYQLTIKQPINLNNISEQLFVELGLEHIQSETFIDEDFSYAFTPGLPDGESKITALRLATEYINKGETSSFLVRSQFSLGIDLLDATVTNAGIDGLFWSWQGIAQWLKKLNDDDWILVSNLDLQLTPDKLLPIEQISLGGINSVRGYRQNLSIGDNGVIGSVELQIPLFEFLRFNDGIVKLNPFIDGGDIWNNQDEEIEDSTLFSIGLGVSLEVAEIIDARVDYGIPLIEADLPDDFDEGEKLTFSLVVTP
jgi:filamentous hemagglutinin family protein